MPETYFNDKSEKEKEIEKKLLIPLENFWIPLNLPELVKKPEKDLTRYKKNIGQIPVTKETIGQFSAPHIRQKLLDDPDIDEKVKKLNEGQ